MSDTEWIRTDGYGNPDEEGEYVTHKDSPELRHYPREMSDTEKYSYTGDEDGDFIIWENGAFVANVGSEPFAQLPPSQMAFDCDKAHAELIVNALNSYTRHSPEPQPEMSDTEKCPTCGSDERDWPEIGNQTSLGWINHDQGTEACSDPWHSPEPQKPASSNFVSDQLHDGPSCSACGAAMIPVFRCPSCGSTTGLSEVLEWTAEELESFHKQASEPQPPPTEHLIRVMASAPSAQPSASKLDDPETWRGIDTISSGRESVDIGAESGSKASKTGLRYEAPSLRNEPLEQSWIASESQLPQEGVLVLACDLCSDTEQKRVMLLAWTKHYTGPNDEHVMRWDDQSGDSYQDYRVTHWQPLPAPPQPSPEQEKK